MKSHRKELWFNLPTRRGFVNWHLLDQFRSDDGAPQAQFTTTFLFSWYNNIDLDSQVRFGVP